MLELPRFNVKEKENNPLDALPETKFDLISSFISFVIDLYFDSIEDTFSLIL